MHILIRGIDKTKYILSLETEEAVTVYFEQIKDKAPIGDEATEHWEERNNNLLAAMLSLLAKESQKDAQETLSEASEERQPLFDYDSLDESEEDAKNDSGEYSEPDVFYYG